MKKSLILLAMSSTLLLAVACEKNNDKKDSKTNNDVVELSKKETEEILIKSTEIIKNEKVDYKKLAKKENSAIVFKNLDEALSKLTLQGEIKKITYVPSIFSESHIGTPDAKKIEHIFSTYSDKNKFHNLSFDISPFIKIDVNPVENTSGTEDNQSEKSTEIPKEQPNLNIVNEELTLNNGIKALYNENSFSKSISFEIGGISYLIKYHFLADAIASTPIPDGDVELPKEQLKQIELAKKENPLSKEELLKVANSLK